MGIGAYVYYVDAVEIPVNDVIVVLKNDTTAFSGSTSDNGKIFFNASLGFVTGNYTLELEEDTIPDFLTGEFIKGVTWYEWNSTTVRFELGQVNGGAISQGDGSQKWLVACIVLILIIVIALVSVAKKK